MTFPAFQFVAYDESQEQFLGVGNTVPLAWSGADAMLPNGVPDVLGRAFAEQKTVSALPPCAPSWLEYSRRRVRQA